MTSTRSLSLQAAVLLPIAAGFFGTLLSISVSTITDRVANAAVMEASAYNNTAPSTNSSSTVSTTTPGVPVRLIIPGISLNAAVQSVGFSKTGDGDIGVPSNFVDVAWYNRSPTPGSPGISIIDGHLDGRYVPQAVFYNLGDLTKGESIYVKDQSGVTRQFVVVGSEHLPYNADTGSLFANSGTPQLVLITCAGDWLSNKDEYTDRIVVFAVPVS